MAADKAKSCLPVRAKLDWDAVTYQNALEKLADDGAGDNRRQIAEYRRTVGAEPNQARLHQELGLALAALGKLDEAATSFQRAIWIDYADADGRINLAVALVLLERWHIAAKVYRGSLALTPNEPDAWHGIGAALATAASPSALLTFNQRTLSLSPSHVHALQKRGEILIRSDRADEAAGFLRLAIVLAPGHWQAHVDFGVALTKLERRRAAIVSSVRATAISPAAFQGHLNAATALAFLGETKKAFSHLWQAVDADMGQTKSFRQLLALMSYADDFNEDERWAVTRQFGQRYDRTSAPPATFDLPADPDRRLRVGYLSSDLYDHVIARNLLPVLEKRDRDQFDVICFAGEGPRDPTTAYVESVVDGWRHVGHLADPDVARLIRSERIDILVILGGRFDRNRPQVASHRAAPLQISMHDAGSSGLSAMDYLIADRTLVPPPPLRRERFAERVLRLPSLYVYAPMVSIPQTAEPPCIGSGYVTFGCLNNPMKMTDRVLRLWGRLLSDLPQARLRLKYLSTYKDPDIRARVVSGLGVDAGRVEFLTERTSFAEHLQLYRGIDVALDTSPFTGSTTTWEALWMGVPVVTLLGENIVGRTSAGLMVPLKLDSFVAHDDEEYLRIAYGWASDPIRLTSLRLSLRDRLLRSPFYDSGHRARQIERLYRAIWRRWCRQPGHAPRSASTISGFQTDPIFRI